MRTAEYSPPWRVLLIGGNSGAGKTPVSRRSARRFGVALPEVDDFRLVLERMTTPEQQPDLHTLLALFDIESQPWSPAGTTRDALIRVAHRSCALEIVVANHVATDTPIIIEGDGIVPAFAAQRVSGNRDTGSAVRAVFLGGHVSGGVLAVDSLGAAQCSRIRYR